MCRWLIWGYALAYLAALLIWFAGTFGWIGAARDPLSAVYLIPLGWPSNLLIDRAPELAWPALAALAPGVNLALLVLLCRVLRRHGAER